MTQLHNQLNQVEFDGTDYVLNNNIAFLPQEAQVEITQIDFDVDALNEYSISINGGIIFSQDGNYLVLSGGMISGARILEIINNNGVFTLTKADSDDYDLVYQYEVNLIVSYSYLGETYQARLPVSVDIESSSGPSGPSFGIATVTVVFDGTDYVLNNNIFFYPDDAQIEITQIDFDVDGMNSYEGFPEGTEFSQSGNVLVGTIDTGYIPISLNLLKIVVNDGTYTLSKGEGYDTAMDMLSAQDIHQIQFDLIVSYSYLGQIYQGSLTVMINF